MYTITGEGNFTEQFSGIPPSVGAIVVALRSNAHGLDKNRELYQKGTLITKASLSLGALQLPTPEYDISFPDRRFGRVFADWISFTGGSVSNGLGDSLSEFAKSPLLAWRILQDPGSYSSTASLRFSVASTVGTDCEIVIDCYSVYGTRFSIGSLGAATSLESRFTNHSFVCTFFTSGLFTFVF